MAPMVVVMMIVIIIMIVMLIIAMAVVMTMGRVVFSPGRTLSFHGPSTISLYPHSIICL